MTKLFVIILENGKKLQFDESIFEYRFVTDNNGNIMAINVIHKETNKIRNRINFSHVLYICDHVKKREYRKDDVRGSELEAEQDKYASVHQDDTMIGSIDNDILEEIREDLPEDSEPVE